MGSRLPHLLILAALFAAAEVLGTVALGFFSWDRAEADLFLSARPIVLLTAAIIVAGENWRHRIGFYGLFLIIAAASETFLILAMGATDPLPEAARGIAAGALLVLAADLLFQAIRSIMPARWSILLSAAAAVFVLAMPGPLAPYQWVLEPAPVRPAQRPDLLVMTGLPIIWGESGAFDPASKPAEAYKALQLEFQVRPLDVLDLESLASAKLLLLAQPRALNPEELVALDQWVRAGGRALILTDPLLGWQSPLAVGDVRRPPAVGLLGPLLVHWGMELEPAVVENTAIRRDIGERRVEVFAPGKFRSTGPTCNLRENAFLADCRIGAGRAMLVADADLLHDRLWTSSAGSGRRARTADNPLFVADLLDQLLGNQRPRIAGDVQWASSSTSIWFAMLLGLMPLGTALLTGLILRRKTRS